MDVRKLTLISPDGEDLGKMDLNMYTTDNWQLKTFAESKVPSFPNGKGYEIRFFNHKYTVEIIHYPMETVCLNGMQELYFDVVFQEGEPSFSS